MAITSLNKTIIGKQILMQWTSDISGPTYYMYKNGLYIGSTTETQYYITNLIDGEIFRFEVYDIQPTSIDKFYPGYFNIGFYNKDSNILSYYIYEIINSGSSSLSNILNTKSGKYFYNFNTKWYPDTSVVDIEIKPKYINGTFGDPFLFNKQIITYPSTIKSSLNIDSSGIINVNLSNSLSSSVVITFPTI